MKCPKCLNKMIKWFDHQIFTEMHCSNCGYDCPPTEQCFCPSFYKESTEEMERKYGKPEPVCLCHKTIGDMIGSNPDCPMHHTKPEPEAEKIAKAIVGKWGYEEEYWWKPIAEAISHSQASLLERVKEWVNDDNNAEGWWGEGKDMHWTVLGDQLIKFLDKLKRG